MRFKNEPYNFEVDVETIKMLNVIEVLLVTPHRSWSGRRSCAGRTRSSPTWRGSSGSPFFSTRCRRNATGTPLTFDRRRETFLLLYA